MTERPAMQADHYLDALAICLATLHNDDEGLMAIVEHADDLGMSMQALVRMHLVALSALTDGTVGAIDARLVAALDVVRQVDQ